MGPFTLTVFVSKPFGCMDCSGLENTTVCLCLDTLSLVINVFIYVVNSIVLLMLKFSFYDQFFSSLSPSVVNGMVSFRSPSTVIEP